jgi:RNA polymerase sigma-70 factor (ECF subfamily)
MARPASALDLAEIYRRHHDLVWRSLRGLGVAAHAVDDATQDVFVVVQRRREDYDGRAPVRQWVLGIARNVAAKYRERSARKAARLELLEGDEPPVVAHEDATEAVAQREAADLVTRFLDTLDDDRRAVFVLADVEGLTAPEIAELLGVKLNTVYSRLRLARRRLELGLAAWREDEG